MSTQAVLPEAVEAFRDAMLCGFRNDYTTSTGRKLFSQDESQPCVMCGAPTGGTTSNEGVFYCSREHWREFVNLSEYKAWGKAAQEADDARTLALAQWKDAGEALGKQHKALTQKLDHLQFAIGDWFVTGEEHAFLGSYHSTGCKYPEAEKITGYSLSSLRNFAYVARHVPASIRNGCLPWGIHQLLAPLKDVEDQKRILQEAAAENLSVAKVRDRIKDLPSSNVPKTADEHDLVSGLSVWTGGHCYSDVHDKYGTDVALGWKRISEWFKDVRLTGWHEQAWESILPHVDRVAAAKRLREIAAEITAKADYIETFQPPAAVEPVQEAVTA